MEKLSCEIVSHAQKLAREVGARALVVYADALTGDDADTFRPSMALLRAVRAEVASR